MGFNDFWINNNGKKEHLNNAKHGVRKEQVDKKFHNLFDAYDANGDGTLETEELGGVFKGLTKFAGADKTLDASENKQVASLFANQAGIQDADFMGFVRSVSKATEDIVDSKTTPTADGGREVTTTYKDGSVETISYYSDGEYKFKKLDQKGQNQSYYLIGNNTETAEDVAVRCRRPEDFMIYEILAKADFENVNKDFHISRSEGVTNQAEFDKFMQDKMEAIDEALTRMYSRANLVFDTQFMQNGEKFPRQTIEVDGEPTELKVLNLSDLKGNDSLQEYGFSTGVTKESARFTVHMTDPVII